MRSDFDAQLLLYKKSKEKEDKLMAMFKVYSPALVLQSRRKSKS
jgi:hypothetical protein